jgi:hypothetical protein
MPFLDRFWELRAIGALLLAVGAAGVLWLALPAVRDDPASVLTWSGFIVAAIVLFLAGTALALAVGAARGRDRGARRRAAIEGNQDAVPRSRIKIDSASAPTLAIAPLVIEWPIGKLERPLIARIRVWAGVVGIVLGATQITFFFTPWFNTLIFSALMVLFVVFGPFASTLRRTLVQTYGSPRRMTLNAEGILWEPILGLQQLIRWHDVRLLEVSSYKARPGWTGMEMEGRRYTLYTPDMAICIWWNDFGRHHHAPAGDLTALLAAVSSHTGLVPRTFDPELQARDPSLQVNGMGAFARPTAPLRYDAEATYELVLARPVPTMPSRIIAGTIGAVLSAGAIVVLWALGKLNLFAELDVMIRYTVAGLYLVLGGVIGPVLLIAALRHPPRSPRMFGVRADATGLRRLYTADPIVIPWTSVEFVKDIHLPRGRKTYVVKGEYDDETITWPGDAHRLVVLTPETGARPITSEDLVALVAVRSGKAVFVQGN